MMNELKPCPFCGCKLEKQEYFPLRYRYRHPENGCFLVKMCLYTLSEYKAWNRRVRHRNSTVWSDRLRAVLSAFSLAFSFAFHFGIFRNENNIFTFQVIEPSPYLFGANKKKGEEHDMAQDIVFAVNGTGLALTSAPGEITAGSLNANRCVFSFNNEWAEFFGRIAYFGTDRDRMMPVLLTVSNSSYSCTVPAQVLQALSAGGKMYISVGGSKANEETLRTKLYALTISDSGEAEIFITGEERDQFLIDASAAIATLEGKSIQSVAINASHELVITMENGTVYNLGNVKGDKGDKGDTGATGAQGPRGVGISNIIMTADGDLTIYTSDSSAYPVGHVKGDKGDKGDTGATGATGAQGVPGTDGADGEDGVSVTGVTASLDAQNRRVFTFAFSDGTSQAVIVPGEVITVTDEEGEYPQAMTVQAAVQTLANACSGLDGRITANSNLITALNASKADKTIVTGTDNKNYYVQFGMQSGKPALILTEVQTNE